MDTKDTKVERGSDNVFTDLGQPDPDAHLLKAELVTRIDEIIRRRGLKQVEAAKLLGLSQPDVSRLLRGSFREYSIERLLRLLTALGRDVQIVIRQSQSQREGRLSIAAEAFLQERGADAVKGDLTRYLDRPPDVPREPGDELSGGK